MNRKNLNQIFDAYIQHFAVLNDSHNNKSYKWSAIVDFQKAFDLSVSADGFAGMLKEAKDVTENLIDSYTQPFHGLYELAKREPETVRAMLTALLEDDGGDLVARQEKIDNFLAECDQLVESYFPGSHLYKNDQRSAMAYLFLNDPDNHYLYKATEAKYLADCVGFYDDWGTMSNFKLEVFHRFCDELIEEIKATPALMATHQSRFVDAKKPMHEDEFLHVLVFDIIYCAHTYNLYSGLSFDKVTSADRKLYQERKAKAQELAAALRKVEDEIVLLDEARTYFGKAITSGAAVTHKMFGPVVVESISDGFVSLKIQKNGEIKKFGLLNCIAGGFVKIDVPDFDEMLAKFKPAMMSEYTLPQRLKSAQDALHPYEKYLN